MNSSSLPEAKFGSSAPCAAAVSNARRWWIVGLLFTASMINYMDRATLSIALPLISKDLALSPATKGLLLSAFFWSYALMQIPIGWCADRFNLRWIYAGAFAIWSLAQALTGFAGSLGALLVLRVVLGIGESIYLPGGTKIVSLLFRSEERGLPSGLFDMGTRTGLVVDGILIPWLIVTYGWRRMFIIIGFSALVWLLPWLLIFPGHLRSRNSAAARSAAPVPGASAGGDAGLRGRRSVSIGRNLVGICLGFFCFDYYWYLLVTWLPDYLVTVRHLTLLRAGFFAAIPYFVFGASEPIGGWIADRLIALGWNETKTRKGIVTVAFCAGLCLIPAAMVKSAAAAIALVIGGSLVGLATGNLLVILQACAPTDQVGVWTGTQNFVGNIAGIIAPITTGLLISWTGSYSPAFVLAAMVLLSGLLSYWFIVGELRPVPREAGQC
jgi:ACS family D-galactonate transporter-like MFS transporter